MWTLFVKKREEDHQRMLALKKAQEYDLVNLYGYNDEYDEDNDDDYEDDIFEDFGG